MNERIKPRRHGKPHIILIYGYWRVSPLPNCVKYLPSYQQQWQKAHAYVIRLNEAREFGMVAPSRN